MNTFSRLNLATKQSSGCLVFLFSHEFKIGFEVLLHSLRRSKEISKLDIVIITDDLEVVHSAEIAAMAKVVRYITPAEKSLMSTLPKGLVNEKFHLDWSPAYTFLKFFIFQDFGYDFHIYLDCDIVCLNSMDKLVEDFRNSDADMMGGCVFPKHIWMDSNGSRLEKPQINENIRKFIDNPEGNLNTGVLIYGKRMMDAEIPNKLLDIARKGKMVNEQAIVHRLIKESELLKLEFFTPLCNFRSNVLRMIDRKDAKSLLREIVLLHYIASPPWNSIGKGGLPGEIWETEKKRMEKNTLLKSTC
ncbi:glycosyltransferase [Shimia thalassica]|uniref:glycosyltransferase n=1 Tax=Shimia thalassica TaxID=1715693 RepID=UPI0026E3595C|nr:glycosyltransferase [Shimia thalassica]MDO6521972.1 glycosyltransferase [Shimia thalassica]